MAVMKQELAMPVLTDPSTTGAPTRVEEAWHGIDWRQVNRHVRRLQARIVKATKEGRWGKVKALQRLLTHSFSAKALAVKRVTENKGKRTAGVDGEIWNTPAKKMRGVERLGKHGYKAQPLRRLYIPKRNGKKRPLGIPTMLDRAQQALHLLALDPVAETTADCNSYGFRKERSAADAIEQCFKALRLPGAAQWILEADIEACFDRINHTWLETHIPTERKRLHQWLKSGYIERDVFHRTEQGSPQGGIISPVMANMTLDGLEALLAKRYPRHAGNKVHLVRYADDLIITAGSRELLEEEILPLLKTFLQERGLNLSAEKTTITHIDEGFDFLGQNVRKYKGKLIIKPSTDSERALLRKVREILKDEGRRMTAQALIGRLNPIIRGWVNYHRHVVSKETFQRVDYQIYCALWRWAKRRHKRKSIRWIRRRYFADAAGKRRVFHAKTRDSNGKQTVVELAEAAEVPIKRHIKVRKDANPYDPVWETYFELRRHRKVQDELRDRPEPRYQWQRQQGICPVCGEIITKETGWHNHHIIWRVYGGGDEPSNRVLLHPNCHQQVHSPDYNGPSLRLSKGV
jgi:RNA-directed DNA polymerase